MRMKIDESKPLIYCDHKTDIELSGKSKLTDTCEWMGDCSHLVRNYTESQEDALAAIDLADTLDPDFFDETEDAIDADMLTEVAKSEYSEEDYPADLKLTLYRGISGAFYIKREHKNSQDEWVKSWFEAKDNDQIISYLKSRGVEISE